MFIKRKIGILSALLVCSLFLSACTNSSMTLSAEKDYWHCYYARAYSKLYWPATNGYAPAQYMYGYLYYYGLGTARDQDVGREWIRRSAEKGYWPAIRAYRSIISQRYPQYIPFQGDTETGYKTNKISGPLGTTRKAR